MRVDEYWAIFDENAMPIEAYRDPVDAMRAFIDNPQAVSLNIYIPEPPHEEETDE